jgi:hypothetical protein
MRYLKMKRKKGRPKNKKVNKDTWRYAMKGMAKRIPGDAPFNSSITRIYGHRKWDK